MTAQTFTTTLAWRPLTDVVTASDATHLDCPILNKIRALTVPEGGYSRIAWQMRRADGTAISLRQNVNQVIFRFSDGSGADSQIVQVIGSVSDAADGLVQCELPDDLVANAGMFAMNIAVTDNLARIWAQDSGLLSVERTLFGDIENLGGPPTLSELRLVLRDTLIENSLLDDVEFDDAELYHCIIRPIQYWNSTPPPVAVYTTRNFPFREAWTHAIVANVLKTAAIWYERNRLPASHGGVNVDDKNKLNPYLALAQQFDSEWKQFVLNKKIEINVNLAYGSVSSPYN